MIYYTFICQIDDCEHKGTQRHFQIPIVNGTYVQPQPICAGCDASLALEEVVKVKGDK